MSVHRDHFHKIRCVAPGSIAEEYGIEPGDSLLSVNGHEVEDVFDYRYLIREEELLLVVRKGTHSEEFLEMGLPEGEPEDWEVEIEKDPAEDLGIEFESGLMDEYRACKNRCVFCFIDQMPPGMRETLYFHDDDARLSFLQGNYITLTNMSDHDIDRIIRYHLEPINISFHTMNPQLRCRMLHNRFAGSVFPKIKRLKDAGIELNGQVVLCKGINDGQELDDTIRELEQYLPQLKSVSVVPVGLTRFREHLPKLELFGRDDAKCVIAQIARWQAYYMERYGIHLVHASDEWYLLAGEPIPAGKDYDGYLQLENGVGMVRLLMDEVEDALHNITKTLPDCGKGRSRRVTIATGKLAAPVLQELAGKICAAVPGTRVRVIAIRNDFFGETITVSGLITGQDLVAQLSGQDLGDRLLLPANMLRANEQVFLDDMTVRQVEEALQVKTIIVESDGQSLVNAVTGMNEEIE
ncbi:MAG TPA: radical SAM protein [Lachnospiraceae bacterium]|nr:radical SAM protein [Lachnospiraceae bacterium]